MKNTITFNCSHRDCSEMGIFRFKHITEKNILLRKYLDRWKCNRHMIPNEVLSEGNSIKETTLVSSKSKRYSELKNLYWYLSDSAGVGRGLVCGPGFKAYANDFPEGTELVIKAEIRIKDENRKT
jgi:hypothetical protein